MLLGRDVEIAFATSTVVGIGVCVLALELHARALVAATVPITHGEASWRPRIRRCAEWAGAVASSLLVVVTIVVVALLVFTYTYVAAAGLPKGVATDPAPSSVRLFAVTALCAAALGLLILATSYLWYFRSVRRRLLDDWSDYLGPDWRPVVRRIGVAAWTCRSVATMTSVGIVLNLSTFLVEVATIAASDDAPSRLGVVGPGGASADMLLRPSQIAVLVILGAVGLASFARPHFQLVASGLAVLSRNDGARPASSGISPSRWRSRTHRDGFTVARRLRRCTAGLRGRLPAHDFATVSDLAPVLAGEIEKASLTANTDPHERVRVRGLTRAGMCLPIAADPSSVAETVLSGSLNLPPRPGPSGHRARLPAVLDAVSDQIQRHWPAVRVVLTVAVLVVLIVTGQIGKVVELFKA